jgi:hypothetical protein
MGLCRGGVHSAPCIGPPSSAYSIAYGVRTNVLSKREVRLRKLIGLISELTNGGVFFSAAWSSKSSDAHSEGSVMREHVVQPVLEEGYHQRLCQGLHSV